MANGDGEREDFGEIVVSKIRPGMKREFEMMMKAQTECKMTFGERRVTRSQNAALSTKSASKNVGSSGTLGGGKGLKSLNAKKRKKEVKNEVIEGLKDDRVRLFDSLGGNGDGDDTEMVELVSEEEEQKSDVLDGMSDDDAKGNRIEDGAGEGPGNGVKGLEIVGSNVVQNVGGMGVDVGAIVATEEPVDGILERVNGDLPEIGKERGMRNSGVEVKNSLEISDADSKGRDAMVELDKGDMILKVNNNFVKPLKQYARLKSKVKTFGQIRTEVGKVPMEAEDSVPLMSLTNSTLTTWADALEQVGVEDDKGEVLGSNAVGGLVSSSAKLELKMSEKELSTKIPTRLKELLETGLLEGLHVCYLKGAKVRAPGDTGLHGEIRGAGILCFCNKCKRIEVVSPNQFELHAGSGNKRPPDYIYLDNGKTLRDVLNLCKNVPSDLLEQAIHIAVGPTNAETSTHCLSCKGSIHQHGTYGRILCDSCMAPKESHGFSPALRNTSARYSSLHVSGNSQPASTETKDTREQSLPSAFSPKIILSSKTVKLPSSSHCRSKGQGRLTRKDLRLHKLVFESDLLPDGTQLAYYCNGKKMLEGYKSGHGIYCDCCHEVVSPSLFEAHAGFASRRKPYLHIYTSNGVSLHELSIEIKKTLNVSTDESDDVCSICEGMGELLCCDNCPRAFHQECVNLPSIPRDKWYCRYCENMFQREKFVACNINAIAAGRIAGVDPFEEIKKRCIRIVETLEAEESGCVLCRGHDFSKSGFGPRTVILCDQCEKEYHIGCLKEHGMDDLKDLPDEWFCSKECRGIYSALKQLVDDGEKTLPNSMLSIIRKKQESVAAESSSNLSLTWRLLRGKRAAEEHRKWLSGAVSVFHDRFDPIDDSKSSRNDLIPIMIYGRHKQEQDFGGMHCAVLISNSKVVSAGIFRIFGREVAEIPLVATSFDCQGKGYFQALLGCIENLLASLEVKEMVLPAATEAEAIWKNKFGFENLSDEKLHVYRKDYPVMFFQGTSILHKPVPRPETSNEANDV